MRERDSLRRLAWIWNSERRHSRIDKGLLAHTRGMHVCPLVVYSLPGRKHFFLTCWAVNGVRKGVRKFSGRATGRKAQGVEEWKREHIRVCRVDVVTNGCPAHIQSFKLGEEKVKDGASTAEMIVGRARIKP